MNIDIRNVAKGLIKNSEISNGIMNMVEMAFRSYDPCFGCATHNLPGEMPLTVRLRASDGTILSEKSRGQVS